MGYLDKIHRMLKRSTNGTLMTAEVSAAGLPRAQLKQLVDLGEIYSYSRGIYVQANAWEDEMFLLQQKYSRGIFSGETALYLFGYSDQTPSVYAMTFPQGYNTPSLKEEKIFIKRVVLKNYSLGITEVNSPSGNKINVYDIERTLCDIMRGNDGNIQLIGKAMKKYVQSKEKNFQKLIGYAEKLRVKPKILNYLEVLL